MAFKIINYDAYNQLLINSNNAEEFIYKLRTGEYDHLFDENYTITHPVELKFPNYIPRSDKKSYLEDDVFAISFYETLQPLTRFQLSDKRLWATLTLLEYRVECLQFGNYSNQQSSDKIKKDFFFEGLGTTTPSRNLLSKIFWGVKLTYDASSDDPYTFTKLLFRDDNSQTFQDLTQRIKFLSNKELTFGYLLFMKDQVDIQSKTLAPLLLNHLYSYDLGNYNRDDIKTLLESLLNDYMNISR